MKADSPTCLQHKRKCRRASREIEKRVSYITSRIFTINLIYLGIITNIYSIILQSTTLSRLCRLRRMEEP